MDRELLLSIKRTLEGHKREVDKYVASGCIRGRRATVELAELHPPNEERHRERPNHHPSRPPWIDRWSAA
jgi:hypothetical protein